MISRIISIDLKVPDHRVGRFPESSRHSKFIIRRKHVESVLIPSLQALGCFTSVAPFEAITMENRPWEMDADLNVNWEGDKIKYLSETCIGGFLSHLSLWRQCVVSGDPILVVEDDATLPAEHAENMVQSLLEFDKIPDDNLVLYLLSKDPSYRDVMKNYSHSYLRTGGEHLLHLTHCVDMAGSSAYCVKPKAAAIMIEHAVTVGMRSSDGFMHRLANEGGIRFMLAKDWRRGFMLNGNWDEWNHENDPNLRAQPITQHQHQQ